MAKYSIEDTTLNNIADAIREKTGDTATLTPLAMPAAIKAITGGGSGDGGEGFYLTGDLTELYAPGDITTTSSTPTSVKTWFNEVFSSTFCAAGIKTKDITSLYRTFTNNDAIIEIPFELNIVDGCSLNQCFATMDNLTKLPKINGKIGDIKQLCHQCYSLADVSALENAEVTDNATTDYLFSGCYSLRHIPSSFLKKVFRIALTYYYVFSTDVALDEIEDLGVITSTLTANKMNSTFDNCGRLKKVTFETNDDGSPMVVNWRSQTLDLSKVGFLSSTTYSGYLTKYNSGITAATQITDDATYAALKDNPDSWTLNASYSRYNHDSAVETINSLPDATAYLTAGGYLNNTIRLKKTAGALTDAGAIETLTEEEIAVAAAKGWTVTLVS